MTTKPASQPRPDILARLRDIYEQPDTAEEITKRGEAAAELARLAATIDTNQSAEAAGARALLLELDPMKSDHIALAIGAHRLLVLATVSAIEENGQPDDAVTPVLLTKLCLYLDAEGWNIGNHGVFHGPLNPREAASRLLGAN